MKLTQAIYEAKPTSVLISNEGKRYSFADMAPKWYGRHYASFNDVGMTISERKGEWRIEGD